MAKQDSGKPSGGSRQSNAAPKRPGLMPDAPMGTMAGVANQSVDDAGQTTSLNPGRRQGPVAGTFRTNRIPARQSSQSASAFTNRTTKEQDDDDDDDDDDDEDDDDSDSSMEDGQAVDHRYVGRHRRFIMTVSAPRRRRQPLPVPVPAAGPSPLASRSTGSAVPPSSTGLGAGTVAPRRSLRILERASEADGLSVGSHFPRQSAPRPTDVRTPQAQQPAHHSRDGPIFPGPHNYWPMQPNRPRASSSFREQRRNAVDLSARQPAAPPADPVDEQLASPAALDSGPDTVSEAASDVSMADSAAPAPPGTGSPHGDCIWVGGRQPNLYSPSPAPSSPPSASTPQPTSSSGSHPAQQQPRQRETPPPRRIITRSSTSANPGTGQINPFPPSSSPSDRRRRKTSIRRARETTSPSPSGTAPAAAPPSTTAAAPPPLSAAQTQTFTTTPLAEANFVNSAEERTELVRLYKHHGGKMALVRRDLPFSPGRPTSDTLRLLGILREVEQETGVSGVVLTKWQRQALGKGEH